MEPYSSVNSTFSLLHLEDDYVQNNFDTVYPALLKYFAGSTEDSEAVVNALRIALGPCVNLFSLEELDEKLLTYACPVARKVFVRILSVFENYREDNKCEISENFCYCEEIASLLAKAVECVTEKVSTIELMKIGSLLLCSSELLYEFYTHCSRSKQFAGYYLDYLSRNLAPFFSKAQELQQNMFKLMSKIEISSVQCEVDVLNEILTFIYKSGMILMNIDVKTMADLWKGYICTLDKYSEYLKNDHEIAVPVEWLCVNLTTKIEQFISEDSIDSQNMDKTVKILCFILKVIIKITEKFTGCLKKCQNSLLNLLINLNKFSNPDLRTRNSNMERLKQLFTGVDPLLTFLMNDRDFVLEFFVASENTEMNSSKRFPLLLLSCLVVKKLTFAAQETRNVWFGSDFNILEWIFLLLAKCNFELCLELKFPCTHIPGKEKKMTDSYGHLLMHVTPFLLTLTSKEFPFAEKVLMQNILQINPWCSLLASDIWCILARFADSELCYNQLMSLVKMLNQFGTWSELPQKVLLESLIKRLFPLLSRKHRDLFIENHPRESNGNFWQILKIPTSWESEKNGNSSVEMLTVNYADQFLTNEIFNEKDFEEMEAAFLRLDVENKNADKELESKLVKLWKFESSKVLSNPLCKRYLSCLCSATWSAIPSLSSTGIYQVLREMKSSLENFSPVVRLHCLDIVYRSSKAEGSLNGDAVCTLISSLFYEFLTNQNVFVRIRGMLLFSDFAYSTSQTQIITQSIKNDSSLQVRVKNYLQRKHPGMDQDFNAENYLKKFMSAKYQHFCKNDYKMEVYRNECVEPPHKKIILEKKIQENSELDRVIFTLKKESVRIQQQADSLSLAQRKEISVITDMLREVLE